MDINSIITNHGIDRDVVNKVIDLYKNSQHKRELQPSCDI